MVNIPAKHAHEAIKNFVQIHQYGKFTRYQTHYMVFHNGIGYFRKTKKSIKAIRAKYDIDPEENTYILSRAI